MTCDFNFVESNSNLLFDSSEYQMIFNLSGFVIDQSSGSSVDRVFNDPMLGSINGSNATFNTSQNYAQGSEEITLNGIKQLKQRDYTYISTNSIQFTSSPEVGDTILISYNII